MFYFFMVLKNHPLSGEDRKIVSTRLYQSEFLYLKKICEKENNKSINQKLREMIKREINENPELTNKTILTKINQGQEEDYKKIESKKKEWNFQIKGDNNV